MGDTGLLSTLGNLLAALGFGLTDTDWSYMSDEPLLTVCEIKGSNKESIETKQGLTVE